MNLIKFFKELFYQKCKCCGENKKQFYYVFELPPNDAYNHLFEVCTDCVSKHLSKKL